MVSLPFHLLGAAAHCSEQASVDGHVGAVSTLLHVGLPVHAGLVMDGACMHTASMQQSTSTSADADATAQHQVHQLPLQTDRVTAAGTVANGQPAATEADLSWEIIGNVQS